MNLSGILINNKYQIIREIAHGSMSTVYLGKDMYNGNNVAVKILKSEKVSNRVEDVIRFHSEASTISRIEHPNIVRIFDVGNILLMYIPTIHYIVMENIEGETLQSMIENHKTITLETTLEIMVQICDALEHIHDMGIIHRDLKPSNIIIDSSGMVKLIDFGLARIRELSELKTVDEMIGTFAYMAPAQSGIVDRETDERSDIYSLGIMLYEMLTGTLPFKGDSIIDLIHQHLASIPEAPTQIQSNIPDIIEDIIFKLIEKEPDKRYQSAHGLRNDLERFMSGRNDFILGLDDKTIRLNFQSQIVGREDETTYLEKQYRNMLRGNGSLCLISGESGIGKTRLARELADRNTLPSSCVLTSKAYEGEIMTPYSTIQDTIGHYIKIFNQYSEEKKAEIRNHIHQKLRDRGKVILDFNPSAHLILGDCDPLVEIDSAGENRRFRMALSTFLLHLSSAEKGMAIIIDNMQWLDEGSIEILSELMLNIGRYPLLIIGTYRHSAISDSHGLRKLIRDSHDHHYPLHSIHLHRFSRAEINILTSALLHEKIDTICEISSLLYSKSSGNPFFCIELLKQLIEEKAFIFEKGEWIINRDIINNIEISSSLIDMILKRLSLLTIFEKNILSYAAVIGRKFNRGLLLSLEQDPLSNKNPDTPGIQDINAAITKAISLNILEHDINDDQLLYFTHDRVREALYLDIQKAKRRKIHFRIASILERSYSLHGREIFDIANHFIESGDPIKTIEYAYPAGVRAMESFANDNALHYFDITITILENMNLLSDSNHHELWLKSMQNRGEVYLTIGKYDDAIKLFNKIMCHMKTDIDQALLYKQICKAYLKKGDWINTEKYGQLGLRLLGEKLPVSGFKVNAAIAVEFLKFILIKIIPIDIASRKRSRFGNNFTHIISLYLALAWSYGLNNTRKLINIGLRFYNLLYRKDKKTIEDAICMGGVGMLLNVMHRFTLARKHLSLRLSLSTSLDDKWGVAQAYQQLGFCYQWSGNFIMSLESFRKSTTLFSRIGDMREHAISTLGFFENYYYISDYDNLISELETYHTAAIKSGDNYAICSALHYKMLYYLEKGDLDQSEKVAFTYNNFSYSERIQYRYYLSMVELGRLFMEKGEMEKSYQFLMDSVKLRRENNFIGHYIIQHGIYLSEVCIKRYTEEELTHIERKKILRLIKQNTSFALKQSKQWITHRGAAFRVTAMYYAILKWNDKAEKYFNLGITHSESIGRRYELAQCYFDYAMFLKSTRDFGKATPFLEKSYILFQKIGACHKSEIIENILNIKKSGNDSAHRFIEKEISSSFMDTWQNIMTNTSFDDALHTVLSKAVDFTGAQKGCIFIYNDRTDTLEQRISLNTSKLYSVEYSSNIVRKVFETGESIITTNAESETEFSEFSSIANYSLKSIICIPIKFHDKISGVCYIDNPLAKNIFTPIDIRLFKTFIAQASSLLQGKFINSTDISSEKQNDDSVMTDATILKLEQIKEYIRDNYKSNISREALAYSVDMSPNYISKLFRKYTGRKISRFINEFRVEDAARKLRETDINIIDIAYSVGFESLRTFNRTFLTIMGNTPVNYRKSSVKKTR